MAGTHRHSAIAAKIVDSDRKRQGSSGNDFALGNIGQRNLHHRLVIFADGSCGMTELHRNGAALEEDGHRRVSCKAPFEGKSLELKMVCDPKAKSCTGFVGGQKVAAEAVEGLSDDVWHVALGCRNLNCLFEPGK